MLGTVQNPPPKKNNTFVRGFGREAAKVVPCVKVALRHPAPMLSLTLTHCPTHQVPGHATRSFPLLAFLQPRPTSFGQWFHRPRWAEEVAGTNPYQFHKAYERH